MSICLGLYIEDNLIKYAKVSRKKDEMKVEAFGIKFYDNIEKAIDQVIEETYSQKVPISINLSEEIYNYFDMFSLLTKQDLQKAISTEFESYCADRGYNPNAFETRYAICDNSLDKDKIKVIHIAENKIELANRIQQIDGYKLSNISPISMSIPNLLNNEEEKNYMIVNIEDMTTITTILNNKVYDVEKIEEGSRDILSRINLKENSYSKAYEICKNTTIYTSEGKNLQEGEQNYLEDIVPTLYDVLGVVRKKINEVTEKIEKVYITGTAALINNIVLYFQEYLLDTDCEILRPYFVKNTKAINIKDYIEVNSAISLALMGLGEGISGINFRKQTFADKIPDWLKIQVSSEKNPKKRKNQGGLFTWDLGQKLDKTEIGLVRIAVFMLLLIIIYSAFSAVLAFSMTNKKNEAIDSINHTNKEISKISTDDEKIKSKTNEYSTIIENIQSFSNNSSERNRTRNAIPNLLNQIMASIPTNVQITSIENTTDTHIVMEAKSTKYEQLGFFIATLKNEVILQDVISTAGQKEGDIVTIKIEGELP